MATYTMMTPAGMHCGHVSAYNDQDAFEEAELAGYEPVEVTERDGEPVIVVI